MLFFVIRYLDAILFWGCTFLHEMKQALKIIKWSWKKIKNRQKIGFFWLWQCLMHSIWFFCPKLLFFVIRYLDAILFWGCTFLHEMKQALKIIKWSWKKIKNRQKIGFFWLWQCLMHSIWFFCPKLLFFVIRYLVAILFWGCTF